MGDNYTSPRRSFCERCAIPEKEIRLVKLRLKRTGRKGRPFYRIVAMHSTLARGARSLSQVGTYDPVHARVEVDEEAAVTWLKQGAQMTKTVEDLLKSQGILARFRGFEGSVREGALTSDKPKRRRNLARAEQIVVAAGDGDGQEEADGGE